MTELALDVADGWNDWPSTTHVHGPGCYAYQVDGNGFSYAIVFRAVVDNPTPTP
jgi:meiotically up-regulated gene 157 (Mug157) protein